MSIAEALGVAIAELLPAGAERDPVVARAAQLMRRMTPDRIRKLLFELGERPAGQEGEARRGEARRGALRSLDFAGQASRRWAAR